jgi:hypothetical protein
VRDVVIRIGRNRGGAARGSPRATSAYLGVVRGVDRSPVAFLHDADQENDANSRSQVVARELEREQRADPPDGGVDRIVSEVDVTLASTRARCRRRRRLRIVELVLNNTWRSAPNTVVMLVSMWMLASVARIASTARPSETLRAVSKPIVAAGLADRRSRRRVARGSRPRP